MGTGSVGIFSVKRLILKDRLTAKNAKVDFFLLSAERAESRRRWSLDLMN